jgi:hypothetical protein
VVILPQDVLRIVADTVVTDKVAMVDIDKVAVRVKDKAMAVVIEIFVEDIK